MKKKIYMIGNAHLDPCWVWNWQEGSCETKATVRSALDRMNENENFIFVCSSVFVYECIEEFDAKMFEEIKMRVKEGRFVIVGGWIVQPDCNLPSGEGFARQSLYGQRYFMEKFGVSAKVGYNVDSFGHNANMPQLLKKSGMSSYVMMRPCDREMHLDSDIFNWISPDGSQVKTFRIEDFYTYNFKDEEDLVERLNIVSDTALDCIDTAMYFYGVGNHGGGPTKHNIALIQKYGDENKECEVVFGNPGDFFDELDENKLPNFKGELQHHASGCYATLWAVKNGIRRAENDLVAAETYSVISNKILGKKYKSEEFKKAWVDVLFDHFHDIFGGCCIKLAFDDALAFLEEAKVIAHRQTNNALQSLSWAIDTSDASKGLPIVVFNPHSWEVETMVTINKQASRVYDRQGNIVPVQQVFSPAHNVYERKDTMFKATVPACGYSVYYFKDGEEETFESKVNVGEYFLENEFVKAEFDKKTGYLVSFFDKVRNKEMLKSSGAVPTVIDESEHDTWSHDLNYFDKEIDTFKLSEIKILENGPLRATIKVTSTYNTSVLHQYFSLCADSEKLDVKAEIDWDERNKMVKLKFPVNVKNPRAVYEIPYCYFERPCNGEEEPGQMWVAMCGDDNNLALINNNKYSYSFKDNEMNLTVVRSPMYCDHGRERTDESDYTDMGKHEFKYSIFAFDEKDYETVVKASRVLNEDVFNILENNHPGTLQDYYEGLKVDGDGVVISALKRSEDGKGLVLRAYEVNGKDTSAVISGDLLRVPLKADFTKHSVRTFFLADDKDEWKEVLLTEYDM